MKSGIESIFLAYANHSLRDNPENFYKIFEQIEHYFFIDPIAKVKGLSPRLVKTLVKQILRFVKSESDDRGRIVSLPKLDTDREPFDAFDKNTFEIACEAVYAYRDNYCEDECFWKYRSKIFGKKLFSGPNRLKCYECGQLAFIHMLSDLVQGKEYDDMFDFVRLLNILPLHIGSRVVSASEGSPFQLKLIRDIVLEPDPVFGLGKGRFGNCKFMLQDFLEKIISYSLTEFLINNDRRKLKRCPVCGSFFIAGNIRKVHCSKECAKIYKRNYQKTWMQKRRDPESPKYNPKYIS
jgi:hypothetical protein